MSAPRCYVIAQSNHWFRKFCQDARVNAKSKQIICVTYDTAPRMLANFDADNDFIVFLAHWNDFLSWEQASEIIRKVNNVCDRAKSPERRIFRPIPLLEW